MKDAPTKVFDGTGGRSAEPHIHFMRQYKYKPRAMDSQIKAQYLVGQKG